MPKRITEEQSKKILCSYLGMFKEARASKDDINWLKTKIPKFKSFLLVGVRSVLLKAGAFVLLNWGRKTWKFTSSYDLVETFLGHFEEESKFYNSDIPLLVVYHHKGTMENKQLENLVLHCVQDREQRGLVTIVMAEDNLPKIRAYMDTIELTNIEAGEVEDEF